MAVIATVATRPLASRAAIAPPAISICDSTQPPKMSPFPFMSAGWGTVRMIGSRGDSDMSSPPDVVDFRGFSYHIRGRSGHRRPPLTPPPKTKKHGKEQRPPVRTVRRQAWRRQGQFLYRARHRGAGGA